MDEARTSGERRNNLTISYILEKVLCIVRPRQLLRSLRSDDGERVRRQTWSRRGGERSPLQWREKSLKIRAGPGRRVIEEAFLIYLLRSL